MNKTVETETGAQKANKAAGAGAALLPAGEFKPADIGEMLAANRAVVDEMVAMNHDIGAFVSKRMRADIDAMTRLSRCKDWPQVMEVQIDFMSALADDYFSEAGRLMERAARMMEQGPIRSQRKSRRKKPPK